MKKFISEFRDFATRGNAIELAVGVVIGASFGAIVNSLVGDIITPIISYITAGVDFSHLAITLKQAEGAEPLLLTYGKFIQAIITFFFTALSIFLMIKVLNRVNKKAEAEEAVAHVPSEEAQLLQNILVELKNQKTNDK